MTERLEKINAEEDLEVLMPLVRKTTATKKAAEARLEILRRASHEQAPREGIDDFAAFTRRYKEHEQAGTLDEFHEVLRNKIRSVVSEMWMLVIAKNKCTKTAAGQVFLRSGGHRWFVVKTTGKSGGNQFRPFSRS